MATTCDYCGHKSNEVKSGAGISEKGIRINLELTEPNDLNRDILKVWSLQCNPSNLDTLGPSPSSNSSLVKNSHRNPRIIV